MKNSNQPKHTQGEWSVTPGFTRIVTAGGNKTICSFMDVEIDQNGKEQNEANAQRIVKAVNSFDVMKGALNEVWVISDNAYSGTTDDSIERFNKIVGIVSEALKQAELK